MNYRFAQVLYTLPRTGWQSATIWPPDFPRRDGLFATSLYHPHSAWPKNRSLCDHSSLAKMRLFEPYYPLLALPSLSLRGVSLCRITDIALVSPSPYV